MLYRLVRTTKVEKKTGPVQLLSRCLQAMAGCGIGEFRVGLYLSDSRYSKVSAVERAARAFPVLRDCIAEVTDSFDPDQTPYKVITTLRQGPWPTCPKDNKKPDTLSMDLVSEIAAGVPKRWPAHEFLMVIDLEAWPGMPALVIDESTMMSPSRGPTVTNPTAYLRPSLLIGSNWWIPRRLNYLMAVVPFASDGCETTVPISKEATQVLDDLGLAAATSVDAILSAAELSNSQQVRARLNDLTKSYADGAHQLLRPVPEAEKDVIRLGDPAAKGAIGRAFRGKGFQYTWLGRGAYRLVKFSSSGYRCVVDIDVAPMARLVAVEYGIEGPSVSIKVPVPTCIGDRPPRQQAIDPPERLDGLLENAARVVTYYEEQMLPMMERDLPPCPRWFKSL